MTNWGRVITAMITPMDSEGRVDINECVRLAKHLEENGSSAVLLAGTTGESPVLCAEEKKSMFRAVKSAVKAPVIANIGTNSTAASIQNMKDAKECGVDGLLAVVPFYNKPNQESLFAHFSALNAEASLPIMLYNVPGRTGTNMTAETTVRLSHLENIVAVKEASGNLEQLATIVRDAEPGFIVYTGEDAQILPSVAVGAYGVVSVASHVAGVEIASMIDDYLNGNVAKAAAMHLKLMAICQTLFMTANPIPVKAAMNILGFNAGAPRLPLTPANDTVLAALKRDLGLLGKLE